MHMTVNHSANEYVRFEGSLHVNSGRVVFGLMKRAVFGAYRSISEAHLPCNLKEWDFKFNICELNECSARRLC
jgi:hypothetical protein